MTTSDMSLEGRRAPCGQVVTVASHHERDEDCLLTEVFEYACGCRRIRHEYHDGSFSNRVIHHTGRILVDELHGKE
jgi:hypothetical protein